MPASDGTMSVRIWVSDPNLREFVQVTLFDSETREAVATEDLVFQDVHFSNLPPGDYRVLAFINDAANPSAQLYPDVNCYGGIGAGCSLSEGGVVTVESGTRSISMTIPTGAVIDGDVLGGPDYDFLTNADVEILDASTGAIVDSAIANSSGHFALGGLNSGSYLLRATAENHKRAYFGSAEACDERFEQRDCAAGAAVIALNAEETRSGLVLALPKFGRLSGSVTAAENGAPVAGGHVQFVVPESSQPFASASIDSAGQWRSEPLPDQHYVVLVSPNGRRNHVFPDHYCPDELASCNVIAGTQVKPPLNGELSGLNSVSLKGASIAGSILDSQGISVDTEVRLFYASGATAGSTLSVNGQYRLGGVASGSYQLYAASTPTLKGEIFSGQPCDFDSPPCDVLGQAQLISLDAETALTNVNFMLNRLPTLSGRVTNNLQQGVRRIEVKVRDENSDLVTSVRTASDGSYELVMPPGGPYFLSALGTLGQVITIFPDIPCPRGPPCDFLLGDPVTVGPQGIANVDFQLISPASVAGEVTDSGGVPLSADVVLLTPTGEVVVDFLGDALVNNGSQTSFDISKIPPGNYYLRATNPEYDDEVFDDVVCEGDLSGCSLDGATLLSLNYDQRVTGLDFSLERKTAFKVNSIISTQNPSLVNIELDIYSVDGTLLSTHPVIDRDTIVSVSPGDYRLVARPDSIYNPLFYPPIAYDRVFCPQPCDPLSGQVVSIAANSVLDIQFEHRPPRIMRGQVTNALTSEGVAITLEVYNDDVSQIIQSEADGTWEFFGDARRYKVRTISQDFNNEVYDNILCESCDAFRGDFLDLFDNLEINDVNIALVPRVSLSGTVRTADGQPTAATLRLRRAASGELVTIQAFGDYEFRNVRMGNYSLVADQEGFQGVAWPDVVCDDVCIEFSGTLIEVQETNIENVDLVLQPRGSITGNALDSTSLQQAFPVVVTATRTTDGLQRSALNSSSGYRILDLAAGQYQIRFSSDAFFDRLLGGTECEREPVEDCDSMAGTLVDVREAENVTLPDQLLDPMAAITGRIIDSLTKTPPANGLAMVEAWTQSGELAGSFDVQDGRYRVFGLQPGDYSLIVRSTAPQTYFDQLYDGVNCLAGQNNDCVLTDGAAVTLREGEQTRNIDFALAVYPVLHIQAQDRSTAQALDISATYRIINAAGQLQQVGSIPSPAIRLDPGDYTVEVRALEYATAAWPNADCNNDQCASPAERFVSLQPNDVREIAVGVRRIQGLSGQVLDGSNDNSIGGVDIDIWDANEVWVASSESAANGGYSVRLQNGQYFISTDNGQGYGDIIFPDVDCSAGPAIQGLCSFINAAPVTVDGVTASPNDLVLGPQGLIFRSGFE